MRFFLFTLLFISTISFGQKKEDKIPRSVQRSISDLTQHLIKGKISQKDKATAIYEWITTNIEFDYNKLSSDNYFIGVNAKAVLRSKKALSDGFTELMKAMLDEAKIENETISGYAHEPGWKPGQLSLDPDHSWVAMKIDGEWTLCDPAWDAGYIGRLPKSRRPYKEKKYIIPLKWIKKEAKRNKVKEKRELKEEERKTAYDEKSSYTDKIGFVQDPQKAFLFVAIDSFLLDHLPLDPIWQLRSDYVSIEDFALSRDSLKLRLKNENPINYQNYEAGIAAYREKDFLNHFIENGENGFEYNPHNPGIKVLNYYNFMYLVHGKKLQKYARGSVYEIEEQNYPYLKAVNDTIIKYLKLYKTFEKEQFKSRKTLDKGNYKLEQTSDKESAKLVRKINGENEKLLKYFDSNYKRIESNQEQLEGIKEEIEEEFPFIKNYKDPENLDQKIIQAWKDSLTMQLDSLKLRSKDFSSKRNETSFNAALTDINYLHYLLQFNADLVQFKTYSNDENIQKVDSLIHSYGRHAVMIYEDSLRTELLQKDVMNFVKQAKTYVKSAKSDLKTLENEQKIDDIRPFLNSANAIYYEIISVAEEITDHSEEFNDLVIPYFKNNKELRQLEALMEEQEELKEEKHEYISELVEAGHERASDLIEEIQNDSKDWKKKYKQ